MQPENFNNFRNWDAVLNLQKRLFLCEFGTVASKISESQQEAYLEALKYAKTGPDRTKSDQWRMENIKKSYSTIVDVPEYSKIIEAENVQRLGYHMLRMDLYCSILTFDSKNEQSISLQLYPRNSEKVHLEAQKGFPQNDTYFSGQKFLI